MQAVGASPEEHSPEDAGCLCRPSYRFDGIRLEHSSLGVVQLVQAAYLLGWLNTQRRGAVKEPRPSSSGPSTFFVLPVYARFLTFQAWSCAIWGVFYLAQSYFDQSQADLPRLATVIMQLARYASAFTWALFADGVFLFLCFASAGAESLHLAVRVGAMWAGLLVTGCAVLWLRWAGCSTPPEFWLDQLLWVCGQLFFGP